MERLLSRRPGHAALSALALCALVLSSAPAAAQAPALEIEGPRLVEMAVARGGHEGSFLVKNAGPQPALVKARPLDSEADPRLPRGITVVFDNNLDQISLAPGERRKATVRWVPSTSKAREVYGHVVVAGEGSAPIYLGLHGELGGGVQAQIARHALSALIALPLLAALAILAAGASGRGGAARKVASAAAAAQLSLASWVVASLDRDFGRSEGNEGLQFIERQRLGGLDLFVGADGASALVALLVAGAWLLATSAEAEAASLALAALAASGFTLAAFSQDLALLWGGLAAALAAGAALSRPSASFRAQALLSAWALALSGGAFWALSGAVDAPLLADGAAAGRCASLASIVRSDHLAAGRTMLGLPLAAGAFAALSAGLLPLAGLWPSGAWLAGPVRSSGPALVALATPMVVLYTLARVGALATPEGVAWASPALSWGGAAAGLLGAIGALGEGDAARRAGWLAALQVGAAMVGLGAGTPQGVLGALGAGAALSVGLLSSSDPARSAPHCARLGDLVLGGVPGFFGFWGLAWALSGATPWRWAPSLLLAAAWCAGAAAAVRGEREGQGKAGQGPWGLGFGAAAVALGLLPGALLGGAERWAIDLGAFVSPPGPSQVASK